MKKIILYIGSAVFAALMVYNIGSGNLIAKSSDVTLESIKIMAVAAQTELPEVPVICGKNEGPCWDGECEVELTPFGPIKVWVCYFTGWQHDACVSMPCYW